MRSVSTRSRICCTSLRSLVEKYQTMVVRSPSMNLTFGSHPSNFLASKLSATRFIGPVGISGCNSISALYPVYRSSNQRRSACGVSRKYHSLTYRY